MSKFLKTLTSSVKRKSWTKEEDSRTLLGNSAKEHDQVNGGCTNQICLNSAVQCGADSEEHAKRILSILRVVLLEERRSQELIEAAVQVKQWATLNGVTLEETEETKCGYPQSWLREYVITVEMSVEKHFPALPPKGPENSYQEMVEYLKTTQNLVCMKVTSLADVLEDAGLLSYLVNGYNHRLFAVLEILMDRSSSVKEALFLLQWVTQTYLSHGSKGISNIKDDVLRVSDPLLLTGWIEKSKQKILTLYQDNISTALQGVLLYNEAECDYRKEEEHVKIHVDVLQCLNGAVEETKNISPILMTAVQQICCDELHIFVQRYVNAEKKQLEVQKPSETYLQYLFRLTNTCRHLRIYASTIMDANNNRDSSPVQMLENMEAQVSVCLQKWISGIAEEHLKKYFKEQDAHLNRLLENIRKIFTSLVQIENHGEETKTHIANVAYQSVTRAYLRCLVKRKCKELEKRWGHIDKRMMRDAELFHDVFPEQGTGCDGQKKFLLMMSEIVGTTDVESLKLDCAALCKNFPKESKEHLPALLKWKKRLSVSQRNEILVASQEAFQNGDDFTPCSQWWSYCLCCT